MDMLNIVCAWSHIILTRTGNQTIEEWISDSKALSLSWSIDVQILEEPCSFFTSLLRPLTVFARDDLFTNKSHPRRKSGQKSNMFLPVPCKFTRHFTRRTFQNDNDTRYTPTLFLETKYGNLIFLGKQLRFTRGNDEDVWENMYGDACGILTGKGKFCYTLVSRFPWVSME